jgi:DNA invertase Pin-like site-specific DNA recombinase
MPIIAYARVSSEHQNLDPQLEQLKAAGAARIFQEKASGARSDRPALQKAIAALGEGGVLLVARLDRLARSTRDLLNIIATVTAKGATFRSLADAWIDTSSAHGRLLLTILGGLAEFERELIRARTSDGRQRARERGVRMGRHPKLTTFQIGEARRRHDAGETAADIARSYAVHRSTISRLISRSRIDAAIGDFVEDPRPLPLNDEIISKLRERASGRGSAES